MSIQDKAAALRALVFRETEVDPKCEVLVYALRGVSFKGGRVCLGFRAFYGEEAYKKLCSRIPREFSEAVEAVRFRLDHFNELRDGYYTEGLVFVDLDEKGRAYVHDPDTDGRVYLPSLAAHHPDAVYNLDFIPMDQIRVLEEVRYRSSYDVEDLAENIRRYGLLNPLVVFRDKKVYRLYRRKAKATAQPHLKCSRSILRQRRIWETDREKQSRCSPRSRTGSPQRLTPS
jgi:hypothetical protein